MPKLYTYTLLNQDGTTKVLPPCPKKSFIGFGGLYELLDCTTIQLIPKQYYATKKWGRCYVFGDEEGIYKTTNHPNPHFDVLAPGYEVVGDFIKEEAHHA